MVNTTVRQHPNAALTPIARRKMVALILEQGWSVKTAAERFQVSVKYSHTSGVTGISVKAALDSWIVPAARGHHHAAPQRLNRLK